MKKLVIVLLFLCSCAMPKPGVENKDTDENSKGVINENFDPLILNDDDLVVKKNSATEATSDFDESLLKNATDSLEIAQEVQGYRVQICALSDQEAARDIQREAILKFNDNIYLIYDSPYYKVRVGDCTSRYDADKLQRFAVEKGFHDAWVVKTKVKPTPKTEVEQE